VQEGEAAPVGAACLVGDSTLSGPILADRPNANGVRPPRARIPKSERVLLALRQQRQCQIIDALPCLKHREDYRQAVLIVETGVVLVPGCVGCDSSCGKKQVLVSGMVHPLLTSPWTQGKIVRQQACGVIRCR